MGGRCVWGGLAALGGQGAGTEKGGRKRCSRVGVRKSKQKVLAGWISHGQCYAPNERTRGWFPLTIAGLLGCRLSNFPAFRFVGLLIFWEFGELNQG